MRGPPSEMAADSVKTAAPLRVLLVRHAESFNNALGQEPGITYAEWMARRHADPELSTLGRQQAEALGKFLAREEGAPPVAEGSALQGIWPIGPMYVSPLRRTLHTLRPAWTRLGKSPQVWTDAFEVFGVYDAAGSSSKGLTRAEMLEEFPDVSLSADVTENGWYPLDGREELDHARTRLAGVAARLKDVAAKASEEERGETLLLLSHHDSMDLLLQALVQGNTDTSQLGSYKHNNTAMTLLNVYPEGKAQIVCLNRTDHLPPDIPAPMPGANLASSHAHGGAP